MLKNLSRKKIQIINLRRLKSLLLKIISTAINTMMKENYDNVDFFVYEKFFKK